MKKLPISVFIIAKNEEDRIMQPILSVRDWVDEVIVIDSGSTDKTVDMALRLGAKVLHNDWRGYVEQKIFGEKQCKNNWILNIDADEEVSNELAEEIQLLFAGIEPTTKAFKANIVILHRFDLKPHLFAPRNNAIRLYHKDYASFDTGNITLCHDAVNPKEGKMEAHEVGQLKKYILHRSIRSISHAIEKANFYSTEQAKDLFNKNRNPTVIRIVCEPFFWFIKAYFFRRYFLYGLNGFIDSIIFSFARFIRLAKARENFQQQQFYSKEE